MNENNYLMGLIGLLQAANFFYMANIAKKIDKLSNGCFTRHMDLAKKEGQTEMTLNSLHDRVDRLDSKELDRR